MRFYGSREWVSGVLRGVFRERGNRSEECR